MPYPKPTERADQIMFADGSVASFGNTFLSDDGQYRFFLLKPTKWMRYNYNIEDKDLDQNTWTIEKKYKDDLCVNLRATPDNQMWLILTTYDGKERYDVVKKFNSGMLLKNRDLMRDNKVLNALLTSKSIKQIKLGMHGGIGDKEFADRVKLMKTAFAKHQEEKPEENEQ